MRFGNISSTVVNIANPEIIQLDNGDILLATNLRPRQEGIYPFNCLQRSADLGMTVDASILYQAAHISMMAAGASLLTFA